MHSESQESPEQTVPVKLENDVSNEIHHLMQRFKNKFTLNNPRLGERYFNSELHILIHFRFRGSEEFVACFHRKDSSAGQHQGASVILGASTMKLGEELAVTPKNAVSLKRGLCREEQTVFVEIIKYGEMVDDFSCPTTVWFYSVDGFYSVCSQARFYSLSTGFVIRGVLSDRKHGISMSAHLACSDASQVPSSVVQGGTQIVQDITEDHGKGQRNVSDSSGIELALSRLRIYLGSESVRIVFVEAVALGLQVEECAFWPVRLLA